MITSTQVRKHELEELKSKLKTFSTFNRLNVDFYHAYEQSSMLVKYQHRTNTRIIRVDGDPVLLIWCDFRKYYSKIRTFLPLIKLDKTLSQEQLVSVIEVFRNSMDAGKDSRFEYVVAEDDYNQKLLRRMGFREDKKIYKMQCSLEQIECEKATLRKFRTEDIKARVEVQNDIFNCKYRVPINATDILIEMSKPSFLSDFCYFFIHDEVIVGYGQIILQQNEATLVNFGLREAYRGRGLSRRYLLALLARAKASGFPHVALEVNAWNQQALAVYHSCGFSIDDTVTTYVLS